VAAVLDNLLAALFVHGERDEDVDDVLGGLSLLGLQAADLVHNEAVELGRLVLQQPVDSRLAAYDERLEHLEELEVVDLALVVERSIPNILQRVDKEVFVGVCEGPRDEEQRDNELDEQLVVVGVLEDVVDADDRVNVLPRDVEHERALRLLVLEEQVGGGEVQRGIERVDEGHEVVEVVGVADQDGVLELGLVKHVDTREYELEQLLNALVAVAR